MAETHGRELTAEGQQFEAIRAHLTSKESLDNFRMALPQHVMPERLARLALTEIKNKLALVNCDRQTLYGAIIEAGQLGLDIGVRGQCWLVPFKNKVNLMIGYQGLVDLAWRSAKISSLVTGIVWGGDEFDYELGTRRFVHHKPALDQDLTDPENIVAAYAIIDPLPLGGNPMIDVMSKLGIERLRNRSKAKGSGPWVTDYPEMAKKCPLRRLLKLSPRSVELARAVTLDEQADLGFEQRFSNAVDVTPDSETVGEVPEADTVPPGENAE